MTHDIRSEPRLCDNCLNPFPEQDLTPHGHDMLCDRCYRSETDYDERKEHEDCRDFLPDRTSRRLQ